MSIESLVITENPISLMLKLGSIARHAEELISPEGNMEFDGGAIQSILSDPEVSEWMERLDGAALLPVARKPGEEDE